MSIELTLRGARVLRPGGWDAGPVSFANGVVTDGAVGRSIDLSGFDLMPGIVDPHGDGFERHMAPRRGALREGAAGVAAVAAELAACGMTTACLAQFWSWEGGMRGPDFAETVFAAVSDVAGRVPVDLRLQLRLEINLTDSFDRALAAIDRWPIGYVVFNDHLPHGRLSEGRKPPRLTGQALKSGRNPEAHFAYMLDLHRRSPQVPKAVDDMAQELTQRGVVMGSHDDQTAEGRAVWRGRGARISEFPETQEAAEAAHLAGDAVVLGAPNIVRGASHAGNVSALDVVAAGHCDALASDYHYPSPARAAWRLTELGICDVATAWALISDGPARMLGLTDRGRIEHGLRADLVVLERESHRVVGCIADGQVAYLSGEAGARFVG